MDELRDNGQIAGVAGQPKFVQSVERALTMLEEIAASEEPLGASEIARRAGVNRATAWRLLNTLEQFHLVERDPLNGRYLVGYGAARIAAASGAAPLIRRARPVLESLGQELDECVYLQVASGSRMMVLDEVRASQPVRVDLATLDVPLHCGSVGKLFLAFLPESERETYLACPLQKFTARTVVDLVQLRAELDQARIDRYAVAYQEHLNDWGGVTAVACDRRGQPLAFLNVTVPSYRYTEAGLRRLSTPMLAAAAELERRLTPGDVPRAVGE
ncbi:MAG: IclR family transcriptional regulator [Micromonosporaceae bacterium]